MASHDSRIADMAGGEAGEDERPSESGWDDDDKDDGKYPIGFRLKPTTAVKRPAASAHTGAPNKRTSLPDGRLARTRGEGGSGVRMPPVGVGAGAAGCHHGPGLPTHWPSARMPNANGQAPGQAPRMSRLGPPHRTSAIAPNSQGASATTTMMPPPNLDPGQPARLPSPQHPPPESAEEAYKNRVYARLIAEMNLQKAQQSEEAYKNRVYARMIAEMKLQKAQQQDSAARAEHEQQASNGSARTRPRRRSQDAPTTRAPIAMLESKSRPLPISFRCLMVGTLTGEVTTILLSEPTCSNLAQRWKRHRRLRSCSKLLASPGGTLHSMTRSLIIKT
jgi:hypothetical protein